MAMRKPEVFRRIRDGVQTAGPKSCCNGKVIAYYPGHRVACRASGPSKRA